MTQIQTPVIKIIFRGATFRDKVEAYALLIFAFM